MTVSETKNPQGSPLLRGALIFVAVWLAYQIVLLLFLAWLAFVGMNDEPGYLLVLQSIAVGDLASEFWLVLALDVLSIGVPVGLSVWLLVAFFQRKTGFAHFYFKVICANFISSGVFALLQSVLFGVQHGSSGFTGLLVALGIWQYLLKSHRARAVFGDKRTSKSSLTNP
jgi:hypothetical protein